jgi:hypothetical protein
MLKALKQFFRSFSFVYLYDFTKSIRYRTIRICNYLLKVVHCLLFFHLCCQHYLPCRPASFCFHPYPDLIRIIIQEFNAQCQTLLIPVKFSRIFVHDLNTGTVKIVNTNTIITLYIISPTVWIYVQESYSPQLNSLVCFVHDYNYWYRYDYKYRYQYRRSNHTV